MTVRVRHNLTAGRARMRRLAAVACLSTAIVAVTTGVQTVDPANPSVDVVELGASAVRELFGSAGTDKAFRELMSARRKLAANSSSRLDLPNDYDDPYLSWLAAWMVQQAGQGDLFVVEDAGIQLRNTWKSGDREYWYFGLVRRVGDGSDQALLGGPWVMWGSLGRLVTPDSPDDQPWIELRMLSGVKCGDVVQFDLYRVERSSIEVIEHVDPVGMIKSPKARHVLRLPLPVLCDHP